MILRIVSLSLIISSTLAEGKQCKCTCTPIPPVPPKKVDYSLESGTQLKDDKRILKEISGISLSAKHNDMIYAHNDSGDSPRVFVLSLSSAKIISEIRLPQASANDWEDLTVAPCTSGSGSCVFVADFGDNHSRRNNYAIFEFREPSSLSPKISVSSKRHPFTYPRKSRYNAEGFSYHPKNKSFYIVTKGPNRLVKLNLLKGSSEDVCKFDVKGVVTAFEVHPSGDRFLIRTYDHVYEYKAGKELSCPKPIFSKSKSQLKLVERQGEAMTYYSKGMVSISEDNSKPPSLYLLKAK